MDKVVSDALHALLRMAYKATEYETQKEQFDIVHDYIGRLEKRAF